MKTDKLVIDPALAIANAGGDPTLAKDLYSMLQQELPSYLRSIPHAYQEADFDKLYQLVHKLNGSATYCGVPALKQAAQHFERHIKQDNQAAFAEDLQQLCDEIRAIIAVPELEI